MLMHRHLHVLPLKFIFLQIFFNTRLILLKLKLSKLLATEVKIRICEKLLRLDHTKIKLKPIGLRLTSDFLQNGEA